MASLQSLVASAPGQALKHSLVSSSRLQASPFSTALAVPRTAALKAARCEASQPGVRPASQGDSWPSNQRVSGSFFKLPAASSRREDVAIEARASVAVEAPAEKWSTEKWVSWIMDVVGKTLRPALVSLLVAAVLWYSPADALAASTGGRAGGKSFSASRARSYSAPSQSYSRPSQGYSRGYSGPSYIAPTPGYSAPFFMSPWGFSPFGFGPSIMIGGGGGGGIFGFMMFSVMAYFVLTSLLNLWGPSEEEVWEASQRSSVVRLQVGLMGSARQLQKDLERMANRADTSTPEGLHYVLQEAVLSLLRNPDYCIYGYSTSEVTRDSYEGEQAFNRLSMEERSKFKEETLVNVGAIRKRAESRLSDDGPGQSEYIVVTLIAATEGELELPEVKSAADLRTALTTLGSITSDELQAVEILWTPEDERDTLTTRDMLQDYPLLRPL